MEDEAAVAAIARAAIARGWHVAVAESLTSGAVASRLGAGERAADWYRGGVVAYDESVKFEVLGVDPGPVVTEGCARQMAEGVARLLGAQAAIALTGVGGPEDTEEAEAGTVVLAVQVDGRTTVTEHHLDGAPEEVIAAATSRALSALAERLGEGTAR
jgi:nicotinamide-nucleotide amidase